MATFSDMTNPRPGVYTNYKAVVAENFSPGLRGIVTLPLVMTWGPIGEFITITAQQYQNTRTLAAYGLAVGNETTTRLREALKGASTALVWRMGAGAIAAQADLITDVTVSAKYPGTLGNLITVSVVAENSTFKVITVVDGVEMDAQIAATVGDFIPNDWIMINGTPTTALSAVAGITLAGGTDGTTPAAADYTAYLNAAQTETWNVMAIPETDEELLTTLRPQLKTYGDNMRNNLGQKVQIVAWKVNTADTVSLISVEQSYKIGAEQVSPEATICFIAGISAGAAITESNTYYLIPGATDYAPLLSIEDETAALTQGRLLISRRKDRGIVVLKDINTLTTFDNATHSYAFSKNRIIRTLDEIENSITTLYENSFIGKVNNDVNGRSLFRAAVASYMANLVAQGAIVNFNATSDLIVEQGPDIESVIVELAVQVVDSMERLYMTILVS